MLVIADGTANPDWIAADLLAQAEHDASAQSILMTDDAALADAVETAVAGPARDVCRAPRSPAAAGRISARSCWSPISSAAVPLVDRLAPEHLEIMTADPERLSGMIRNAGAIFLGGHTPEAIGDYVGGPNHVLPTARSARFSSGLGVGRLHEADLAAEMRSRRAARARAGAPCKLAEAEGLQAHGRSVTIRLNL